MGRRQVNCRRKRYKTPKQAAQAAAAKGDGSSPVYCDECHGWHVEGLDNGSRSMLRSGHDPISTERQDRGRDN